MDQEQDRHRTAATILLVDDDPVVREVLSESLTRAGFRCIGCATGAEALGEFRDRRIDLALVDLCLPDQDGIEVVRQLKAGAGDRSFLPVVLITGSDAIEERIRGFDAGCDDFIGKPINLFELNARVRSLLTRRAQSHELAEANEKLRELHERKKVLAALVVHDLRNPLSALQGNIDLLAEEVGELDGGDQVEPILGDCRILVVKALSLVAGLLDVEELEEGLLVAEPTEVAVREFVERAAGYHWPTVKARSLSLSFDIDPDLCARFDADLVGRLVENLLDNAVRYAPRKGRVEVAAAMEDGVLVLRVGNDGPPVPESERDIIFGRYYRLEARRSSARANRGLGLYFCKLVAEVHGGTISVEEGEPMAASFVVRLPQ